ncbi:extracellular solute-binding protein [Vallitalea pronyensis]|uniref:Extracellular solute-binding protein n=1 Tax=Vallitalea pronyensis TaxID=1348613 RepID=A0A8J8SFB6_9FIRM|nr:extracellular solute-binding protein [Vallitalea pronyensis]QUI21179.1 extracellular solute-binding protein [Vallitalea pronyensis]
MGKTLIGFLALLFLMGIGTTSHAAENVTYGDYLKAHQEKPHASASITIQGEDELSRGHTVLHQYRGLTGKAILMDATSNGHWAFVVPEDGLYALRVHYYPIEGKSASIERQLRIDGKIPFKEAGNIIFSRVWGNKSDTIVKDINNNDLRPLQIEKPRWRDTYVQDTQGYYSEPYVFYLTKGQHHMTLESIREPMVIDYMVFEPLEQFKSYDEVAADYKEMGYKPVEDVHMVIEGESAVEKSSPTLYPLNDRTSPLTSPYHHTKIRMNTIGGYNWRIPGDWMTWKVEVPKDGLYKLSMRCRQNFLRGIYATRRLMIDGKKPFKEAEQFKFYYKKDWDIYHFGNEEEPYLFYLTKGTHDMTLDIGLGDLGLIFQKAEHSLEELNELYRKIIMITGNVPDKFRDYQLDKQIPELVETLKTQSEALHTITSELERVTGEKSDQTVILSKLHYQTKDFSEHVDSIPSRLDVFKNNITGLGAWVVSAKEQPLEIDYLMLSSPEQEMPRTKATFWEKAKHLVMGFFASFSEDYTALGLTKELQSKEKIKVWMSGGRDQANILRLMIDEMFTPVTGIQVDLQLVGQTVLLPATLGGRGPDVAMLLTNDIPVNYAMRRAVYDISKFDDFDEVKERFLASSLVPYTYKDGVYALPDQQWFPMLFYRKSILEELDIDIPQTWDDLINLIPALQKNNLEIALQLESDMDRVQRQMMVLPVNSIFSALLYQHGGNLYTGDARKSALDSKIAMEAFKQWSDFYTSYKLPLQANFYNRFRTGEIPIGIVDYSYYNSLVVFAPDIRGDWDFAPIPGTIKPNGQIDRSIGGSGLGTILLEHSKYKEASWAFMKWWTEKDTQVRFGREMEGILGAAARYPTANVEALQELPWPAKDLKALNEQWKWVKGIPEVPGGYLTGRYVDNALKKVIDEGTNPRDSLYEYVDMINTEMVIKRKEFGER